MIRILILCGLILYLFIFFFGQYTLKEYREQYRATEQELNKQGLQLEQIQENQQKQHYEIMQLQQQQRSILSKIDPQQNNILIERLPSKTSEPLLDEANEPIDLSIKDSENAEISDNNFLIEKGKSSKIDNNDSKLIENHGISIKNDNILDDVGKNPDIHDNSPTFTNVSSSNKALNKELAKCNDLFERKILTMGKNNAFSCYQNLAELYPDEPSIQTGIRNIANHYSFVAERELKSGNWDKARRFILRLKNVNANHPQLSALKGKLNNLDSSPVAKIVTSSPKNKKAQENPVKTSQQIARPSQLDNTQDPMNMVTIKAGCHQLGEQGRKIKRCIVNDYQIGKYEVTQQLWQEIMGDNPAKFKECGTICPIENVSWYEVQKFIRDLNRKHNSNYRLPSEVEWEYAARAGSDDLYVFSQTPEKIYLYANFCDRNCDQQWLDSDQNDRFSYTAPIGSYRPNHWGIYDMQGNVWEWVQDAIPQQEPKEGIPQTPKHVYKGGSWGDKKQLCQPGIHSAADAVLKVGGLGFRLARSISDT